eukprot:m51a1_g6742 Coatomer subunit alpha (1272) ;mRNA; r:252179-256364
MRLKFETKSNRVKGLSFHPTRTWILASLHNGLIQLWDYRIRTLIDKFDEHTGPVRGVCFHNSQPLFVSGGDDYKIKVWNYKKRRCLFTLLGHLDYIRTVQFHPGECPWILSASDDQTIRIWNWQSRTCLSVLTGHNHYVMCAQFHPREDLIISASLDQTVRVWDTTGLRKKGVQPKALGGPGGPGGSSTMESEAARLQADLFGSTDVVVKFQLEAHERGVNWAAFHPTQPYMISAADDRLVRLWRMNESKAWEVDTFRGHFHNVSCAAFHPRYDIVLSDGEDKTIRVWDLAKRTALQTFRRENDRFWVLAAHPTQNVIAAGHDSGLVLFKLVSERIPVAVAGSQMLYVYGGVLRAYDMSTARDQPLLTFRAKASGSYGSPIAPGPAQISYSAVDRAVVMWFKGDGGAYEMYQLPAPGSDATRDASGDAKRAAALGCVFVGRKRVASIEKSTPGFLIVRDTANAEIKRVPIPEGAEALFAGPAAGQVLIKTEAGELQLFDIQQRSVLAETTVAGTLINAVWSPKSGGPVALVCKEGVTIASRESLATLAFSHEYVHVKGGAWDENGAFVYATLSHIKYAIPSGDVGAIRTLENPVYVGAVRAGRVYCVDREGNCRVIAINPTEYLFKLALHEKRFADVLAMVKNANLPGQSLIAFLRSRGYPDVALYFVKDERLRFDLALECANIEVALEAAKALNDQRCWRMLADAALRQGNHQVVEKALQCVKDFARLSFLYLITGNTVKLEKMLRIAEMRGDPESRFHNALYTGDAAERAKVLADAGLAQLARAVATSNGLAELVPPATDEPEADAAAVAAAAEARCLLPPVPIQRLTEQNWPLLNVGKSWSAILAHGEEGMQDKFGVALEAASAAEPASSGQFGADEAADEVQAEGGWADEVAVPGSEPDGVAAAAAAEGGEGGDGWDSGEAVDEVAKLLAEQDAAKRKADPEAAAASAGSGYFVPPTHGPSASDAWLRTSTLAAEHAAAGSAETFVRQLVQQVGAASIPQAVRALASAAQSGSHVYVPGVCGAPALRVPLLREPGRPALASGVGVGALADRLKAAYALFTRGVFADALSAFQGILHAALVCVVASRQESDEVRELIGICRDYVCALRIELRRRELVAAKEDPQRQVELAAYLTHANLQMPHLVLVLRAAMNCALSNKCHTAAAGFARRLLDLNPKADIAATAQKICQYADDNASTPDAFELKYDERNPFSVCAETLVPVYRGSPLVTCSYCRAPFTPTHSGKLCSVCLVGVAGKENVPGLQSWRAGK